jgi:transcriptional regulator with XRE-family HTH domain
MDLKEIVAANLRRIRHAKKITLEGLADRVGLSSRYTGSVERGAASPTVTVLGKLADVLGLEAGVLVSKRRTE